MSQESAFPRPVSSSSTENACNRDLMLISAISYIDRGWRVFPLHSIIYPAGTCTCGSASCRRKGNHPIRPAGRAGATTRLRDILEWWEDDPHANIGIATGAGLLVITVSPERGGALAAVPIVPVPQTGLISTGDGGWHLYFTCKKTLMVSSQKDFLGPGIDLVAEDGYVVAPPSLNPVGGHYAWTKPEHIAPRAFPPKILALLKPQHGWTRSDYQSVLDLMTSRGFPLTPTEIAHSLHRDYSGTLKLLRRMREDQLIYQVGRGLYAPIKAIDP